MRDLRSMKSLRKWQIQIFLVTWLTYAGYYLCRKNFGVALPIWAASHTYSEFDMANAVFAYSLLYAVAQLPLGPLADRVGSKIIVGSGITIVIVSNLLMSVPQRPTTLTLLACLNGAGQATGWCGLVRCMANWFSARERGVVMAWWGTNYALGGFLATVFATFCATGLGLWPALGWRKAFLLPPALLAVIGLLFLTLTREQPGEQVRDGEEVPKSHAPSGQQSSPVSALLKQPVLWIISAAYFLLEMTRYGFLFWLPLYLTEALNYTPQSAGYLSSLFELVGFVGAVAAGYLSDRVFASRRLPVGAIMLACFGAVILGEPWLAATGYVGTAVSIAAMGMFCYGPDTLLCGAAAQDVGGHQHVGAASGIIDGLGHLGSLASPYLVVLVSRHFGWNALFVLFGILSFAASAVLCFKWNFKAEELSSDPAASFVQMSDTHPELS
jgi:sugar phosphate permease